MPLLGALVLSLFGQLLGGFALALTRKTAVIAAAITAISIAVLGLTALLVVTVNALVPVLPGGLALAAWLFLPYNIVPCTAAILAIDSSCTLFAWYRQNITLTAVISGS